MGRIVNAYSSRDPNPHNPIISIKPIGNEILSPGIIIIRKKNNNYFEYSIKPHGDLIIYCCYFQC